MNNPRETISNALLALLQNNGELAALLQQQGAITRVPKMWTEVSAADQPCLILFKGGPAAENPTQNTRGLTRWELEYNLWLYVRRDAADGTIGETVANNIADAVDAALESSPYGEAETLGGLVNNCYLEGPVYWDSGILDQQMVIMWKIKVITGI